MPAGRAALPVSLQQVSLAGRPLMEQCLPQAGQECSLKGTAESCSTAAGRNAGPAQVVAGMNRRHVSTAMGLVESHVASCSGMSARAQHQSAGAQLPNHPTHTLLQQQCRL